VAEEEEKGEAWVGGTGRVTFKKPKMPSLTLIK